MIAGRMRHRNTGRDSSPRRKGSHQCQLPRLKHRHQIIENGIGVGMARVGERYQKDEYHMPELLYAEEIMRISLDTINEASKGGDFTGVTSDAQERLLELSRSWVGTLSSCVTRLFRYDEERKKTQE